MVDVSKIIKPYFSHDYTPLEDKNLLKLFIKMGPEGYGIYWLIVEFMHQNSFAVGEEDILSYKIRVDAEKIKHVMNDFDLFKIEKEGDKSFYISDRILRNLDKQEEKQKNKVKAANKRWIISAFNAIYEEIYKKTIDLSASAINKLVEISLEIKNLKDILPDILYTLKDFKFQNKQDFNPDVEWLLTDDNFIKFKNERWCKLKHYKTQDEIKKEEIKKEEEQKQNDEFINPLENATSKEELVNAIFESRLYKKGQRYLSPLLKDYMKRFNLTKKELDNA